jgi:methylthioribulose-1-phosphate dehydratase
MHEEIPHIFPELDAATDELIRTAHWCAAKGWVPATSGNFSVRIGNHMRVTVSSLDKSQLSREGLLDMTLEGHFIAGSGNPVTARPSAESLLHRIIYRERPNAGAILHTHSIWCTILSDETLPYGAAAGELVITGYELLKAFSGVSTHQHEERIPILRNTQDYVALSGQLHHSLEHNTSAHGVLLSAHGLYTWGESVAEARRHLEALEFLFEVLVRRRSLSPA